MTVAQSPLQQNDSKQQLDHIAEVDPEVIFRTKSVFPLRFFPYEVSLNRIKLTIVDHTFFFTREVHTVLISDIVRVDLEEAMVLAAIKILDKSLQTKHLRVTHLWKNDARRLRRLIDGLQIAERQGIELSNIPASDLVNKIEQLGTSKS